MKNKNLVLFSILLSTVILSCNNQVSVNTSTDIVNNTAINTNTVIITPKPLDNDGNNIVPTPLPVPSKEGIIRTFIGEQYNKDDYDILFTAYNRFLENSSLAISNDKLYYLNGDNFSQFNFSDSKLVIKTKDCYKYYRPDRRTTNTAGIPELLQKICPYRSFKIKQGGNNISYLLGINTISKIDGENIKEIYKYKTDPYNTNAIFQFAVDKASNIYFSYDNSIKKITPNNKEEWSRTQYNTSGEEFSMPTYIEVDNKGNIYFFDANELKIKKMTPDGFISNVIGGGTKTVLNILGKEYKISGLNNEIKFSIDKNDNIYLIERTNNRILKYDVKSSIISLFAGGSSSKPQDNKPANQSSLNSPTEIAFDLNNNAYILDKGNRVIRKVDAKTNIMSAILGERISNGDGNDLSKVFFRNIINIYSKNNNLYVSEVDRIRKINSYGVTSTIAGNGTIRPSSPPTVENNILLADKATVSGAKILYVDKEDNVYISENVFLKKITKDNKLEPFYQNIASSSLTQDSKGNFYFSLDTIKKVDKNNNIETFAGKEYQNNQLPVSATPTPFPLSHERNTREELKDGMKANEIYDLDPRSLVSDSKDNIYAIVQYTFNRYEYRSGKRAIIKISPDGIIKVLAISNTPETAINPIKLIVDKEDNVYFIDQIFNPSYDLIRKIDPNGKISIYAGKPPFSNIPSEINNLKATEAVFDSLRISDITVDDNGFIYFTLNDGKIYRIE